MPLLKELNIEVGGYPLPIGGYEMLNALLVKNNVLDQSSKSIAIFHPPTDLLDVYLLVIMGLAAYEYSILYNSKLRLQDFSNGELVEYNGRVVWYQGTVTDPYDKAEKISIKYNDQYNTREYLPLKFSYEISKYSGSKTTADRVDTKVAKSNVKDALQMLLGIQNKHIGLSGYPSFLIASEKPGLIEQLREVAVKGTPFFEMFPSVKCTAGNKLRIGRDPFQREYMFYFVSSLSTADDVLMSQPAIRTLMVDARGKTLGGESLIASIRSQYNIEDIYWLQTYSQLDSVEKLDSGLGFKIWIWDQKDFHNLADFYPDNTPESQRDSDGEFPGIIFEHRNTTKRLAFYEDLPVEIGYPSGITLEFHKNIQSSLRDMFQLSDEYGSRDLANFSIHAAGIANKLFQSPLPPLAADGASLDSGRKTFEEDLSSLENRIATVTGAVPDGFQAKASGLVANLKFATGAFSNFNAKIKQAASIIKNYPGKRICIISKYPYMAARFKQAVMEELGEEGAASLGTNLDFVDNTAQIKSGCDLAIWTYKPQVKNSLMLEPCVGKNILLLFSLQKKEAETALSINHRRFSRYCEPEYRSGILKTPEGIVGERYAPEQADIAGGTEPFDLDSLLSSTFIKTIPSLRSSGRTDTADAKMVSFIDGNCAFFQPGNKIRVLDNERKSIEVKTVSSLLEGEEIIFLSDSKRTVFEELVEFYEHKPEVVTMVKTSEMWRTALLEYCNKHQLTLEQLKSFLDKAGLVRHPATIEGWLSGTTICPDEDNYAPVDTIAKLTGNEALKSKLEEVKNAARKMHALRIKIGRYLVKKITQSYTSPDSIIDDPVLRNKLDVISSHVQIAKVIQISGETVKVPLDMVNKIITMEDIKDI